MLIVKRLLLAVTALAVTTLSFAATGPGDQHPPLNAIYPEDVFLHAGKGGRVIDVTKPPFCAKGDGVTDDTAALIEVYDFVLSEMDKYAWNPAGPESPLCEYIIYLPNGTYLVSDSINYSGPWRSYPGKAQSRSGGRVFERLVKIRFFGQQRDKTIIRLQDDCPGFDEDAMGTLQQHGDLS